MPQLPSDVNMHLVDNIDTAMDMKRWLGERRDVLGLDTETSGLDPYEPNAELRLIQIGDHKTGWAIPWAQWGGIAIECLNAWQGQFTLHNLSFDAKWLQIHAGWKIPWHRTDDTLIMAQIERPGQANGLKPLSTQFVDPRADAGEKDLKKAMKDNGWGWRDIPVNYSGYWVYSALDPILAAHLWSHFRTDKSYPRAYDLEMSARRICTNMEMSGMRVDLEYSQKKFDELNQFVEKSKAWGKENLGIAIGSNIQLADLFLKYGAEFDTFSKTTGNPSVDKNQLAIFSNHDNMEINRLAKFVLGVRNADKMSNSYFKNFLQMNRDGIVHPEIKTMGARTGRMSVTNPALQTIPSKDSLVRNAFIPSNVDERIISSDYSQVEMRLLAHFSQDKSLQDAFKDADATGGDFFTNLGRRIYDEEEFSHGDPRRKLVKSTLYGLIYGAGVEKMAETAGIPVSNMETVSNAVHKTFPGIKQFMTDIEKVGGAREKSEGFGYINTESGRKIPADKGRVYSLLNYLLQGTAAEVMKKSLIRLDAAGLGEWMKMPIHDEIVMSMPKDLIEESKPEIASIMSVTDGSFAVDLLAEPEGPYKSWGAKYD